MPLALDANRVWVDFDAAAYGDDVAVLFPSHHARGDGWLRMRLMVFDTSNIQ